MPPGFGERKAVKIACGWHHACFITGKRDLFCFYSSYYLSISHLFFINICQQNPGSCTRGVRTQQVNSATVPRPNYKLPQSVWTHYVASRWRW